MKKCLNAVLATLFACISLSAFGAGGLAPDEQAKVDKYMKKMTEWAGNPTVVQAVKEANSRGGLAGMTNSKWLEISDTDPAVSGFMSNKAGSQVKQWEEDKSINKLVVRDEKGNLVAASTKPLLYNNTVRPVYKNAIKGQAWAADKTAPDPTTQIKSVQASVPVMDGDKVIGVLHAGITIE